MRKVILTVLVAFGFMLGAVAQDRTITGKVTDEKGVALEGVSVTSSKNKNATKTDESGIYTIKIGAEVRYVNFSSVGFESYNKTIGNSNTVNVSLARAESKLDEVVIVGYGVQQKKAFTGSSSKINTQEVAQLVTPSIDKQLAGRAAGVSVNVSSGQVNAPARIRIRGTNSFSQGRAPLFVVDGTPITVGNNALISNSNQLADINPDDIENIEVLKDGSATAIYGSRGANGVIMITTKKGTRNKNSLTYSANVGFSAPVQNFDVLNSAEFVTIANEKFINAGQLPPARLDPVGTNTNWQENVFVRSAPTTSHTLALSGGSDKALYYMSMNYANNNGIIRTNKTTSYRVRANLEVQVNKWFKIGNNLGVSRQNDFDQNNGSNALSGAIVGAIRALPNVPIMGSHPTGYNITLGANSLGQGVNLRGIDDNYTNIAFVLDNNIYNSDQYRLLDNLFTEFTLAKGLKLRSQLGVDYYTDNSLQALDSRHGDGASGNGSIYQGQQNVMNTNIQNFLNYNFSINKSHNFFLTAGHELQQTTSRFFSGSGIGISDLFFAKTNIITGTVTTPSISGGYGKTALESIFGRLNYDYKNKYFLQGSIRRDGQSSLATQNKYGVFPGISGGWRISQENFIKNNTKLSKIFSDIKLRASYAVVGNRLGGFPYLSTFGSSPYGNVGGISPSLIGNPDLQWEQSKKTDYGIDLSLFNSRLNITADYFENNIDKAVLNVPTPFSTGIPGNRISQNIGQLQNKGVELTIDVAIIRNKNFGWNINANYSEIKNKIISLYDVAGVPTTSLVRSNYTIDSVGLPISSIFGYQFAGVNSGNGNPVYYNGNGDLVQRSVANGGYYFANSLSDPSLGAGTTLTNSDKKVLGSAQPTHFGAVTNTFTYKGFTLDVMFRYQWGNKIVNITRQEILLNQKFANGGKELLQRWTTPGQVTDVPKLWYNNEAIVNQNGEAISRFVESGNFLKLQNIGLSYTFDSQFFKNSTNNAIKSARFFVQSQNVYNWTKYRGIDPEAFSEDGQDNSVSPQVRNVSFGVNVVF
jgi:TonB-dependent starch-binding outer membrane protein SusC